jgi:hypothetical protein
MESEAHLGAHVLEGVLAIYRSQKRLGDGAIAQLSEEEMRRPAGEDANSVAVTMKHVAGNMLSRWTDFLASDGEKPWRERDREFEDDFPDRAWLLARWEKGWATLFATVEALRPEDLLRTVTIRSEPHTVFQALVRQVGHYGYHVGQIVHGARLVLGARWKTLSVPRGGSDAYNRSVGHA